MSDGFCAVDFSGAGDDSESVDFHVSKIVRAKKAHTCDSCHGPIAIGEQYQCSTFKFDGTFAMERCCDGCREASVEFGYNILGGDLWCEFREAWANGAHITACLNRLTTAKAKANMREQWLKWKNLASPSMPRRGQRQ